MYLSDDRCWQSFLIWMWAFASPPNGPGTWAFSLLTALYYSRLGGNFCHIIPKFKPEMTTYSIRVNLTFRVKSAHKLKLTDKQLLQWLFPILLVMLVYLSSWTFSDPPQAVFIEDGHGLKFKICFFGMWDHCLAAGEFFFLLWGIKVCFSVRKARTHYNEAKWITWSIYNIALVNIIMVAIQ